MCAIINKLANQAARTFRYNNAKTYSVNLDKLVKLTQCLKPTDIGLSPNGDDLSISPNPLFAPVCHVNIFECEYFTFGVFIIRKGMSLPLHDHPGMTGIVKVLYGTIKVIAYEAIEGPLTLDEHSNLKKIPVRRLPDKLITSASDCQVLKSHDRNFHCVQTVGEDAAIFDILSPPYSQTRQCHYFKDLFLSHQNGGFDLLRDEDGNSFQYLLRVPQPYDFYCDQLPYKGPEIDCDKIEVVQEDS